MKYQLWYSESERSGVLLAEADRTSPKGAADTQLIWTVEANNYDEALRKRDEFLESAGFAFASLRGGEQTTRVTTAVYLDDDGNQQSFEVAGWVGVAPYLAERVAETGGSAILGQIFIERPYPDPAMGPSEITVVTLKSVDEHFSMIQEFAGHLHDQAVIADLVHRRLGPAMAEWQFVDVRWMKAADGRLTYVDEGVLHLIYAAHHSEADYRYIEASLNLAAKKDRPLILLLEHVLTAEDVRECLDPSLRDLPFEALFDPGTVKKKREPLAIAYADATRQMEETNRVWNAFPAAMKPGVLSPTAPPFNLHLLAWASDHCAEVVLEQASLEAWLARMMWEAHMQRTDAAASRGDAAAMWAENEKEWEAVARLTRMRDAEVNAQITRLLKVERRGHDVLYVVGAMHSMNEERLVAGLKAVVHHRRTPELAGERFAKALVKNAFVDQPATSREQLETLAFLDARLQTIARPTTSADDLTRVLDTIAEAVAARNITLRQIVDYLIADPGFQETAGRLDSDARCRYIASTFVFMMIDSSFIDRAEVDAYLYL
jgi:hypothetical protein